eukprot:TRINITY_DN895_c0_g1_i8.p1 TRINITY_DN895_c0_g1~~TRINITY_DN895_c0_g1_i8.p1  ORF type:complete len:648 (+),score=162.78 TRINITY_DN895_c0_g1_i8:157-1944(+)
MLRSLVGSEMCIRDRCTHCTFEMIAANGNTTICPVCLNTFVATRSSEEQVEEPLPRAVLPAADLRPTSAAPTQSIHESLDMPQCEVRSVSEARGCWTDFFSCDTFTPETTPLIPLLHVRGLDETGEAVWYSASVLDVAGITLEHEHEAQDNEAQVHWVKLSNSTDSSAARLVLRSDDVELILLLKDVHLEQLADQPLSLKTKVLRHRLMCNQIPASADMEPIRLELRREQMANDVQFFFLAMEPADFCKEIRYRLQNETDFFQDVGGVTREVYTEAAKQLFAEEEGLFTRVLDGAADGGYLRINTQHRSGYVSRELLERYTFAGMLLAKALMDGYTIPVPLATHLYSQIMQRPVGMQELKKLDFQLYNSFKWMLENDVTHVEETFAVAEAGPAGQLFERELCKEGSQLAVTELNKSKYVEMRVKLELVGKVEEQLKAFLNGVWSVIPEFVTMTQSLDEPELRQIWVGVLEIDVEQWFEATEYAPPCTAQDEVIRWFWTLVGGMSNDQRRRLLFFVTGSSCVPYEGFQGLCSTQGKIFPFSISTIPLDGNPGSWMLPRAHACFNRLDLPMYTSQEQLEENLVMILEPDFMGFGMDE